MKENEERAILHEEMITVLDVLIKVPGKHFVKNF
jgi:hypothetical protein